MDQKIAQLYDEGKVEQAIHLLIKKIDQHPQQVANYLQLSTYLIEQGSLIKHRSYWSRPSIWLKSHKN